MRFLLSLSFLFCLGTAFSQVTRADIKDLQFMSGRWGMQHAWGYMEETWSAPVGNSMMCSFRCVQDSKVVFYEFIVIEQTDSVPVMRLRHFGPGSVGWEEKDAPNVYPLVLLEKAKAQFRKQDGSSVLTFIRQSPTQLHVFLENRNAQGNWEKIAFDYTLQQ